jgi:sigma-B regulation protein RsbU (phosphoserine phosphatase)
VKVLVVDDDPVCRRLLEASLLKRGCSVVTARDGAEAHALAREHKPNIVITDVVMPRLDGFELCRRIKADPELRRAPVILLTALCDSGDVIGALQSGADGFITKPYDKDFLAACMENLLTRAENPGEDRADGQIEITVGAQKFLLRPDARQITQLLLSTYDNALQKNVELARANLALIRMEEGLRAANESLKEKQNNLDRDLEVAAGIQRSLLPHDELDARALRVAWKFQPCQQIGGDIFNMIRLDPTHYAFYILDVSGHGVPSALVTVSVSQMLRPDSGTVIRPGNTNGDGREIVPPGEVLARLDREYPIERFDKFFSVAYVIVDVRSGAVQYSIAGHPPPLLVGADGRFARLDKGGPLIGQGSGLPFEEGRESLKPGDRIILTTDGVTEHCDEKGEQYGDARLEQTLISLAGLPIGTMLDRVMENVMSFGRGALEDDVSLLGVEYRGG